ncbi:MAG: YjbH domain-containing protein [Burkholderiales bacterium]
MRFGSFGLVLIWGVLMSPLARALDAGVSAIGATGGLLIPSAEVLLPGEFALGVSNQQDPALGNYSHRRNYTAGFGMGGGLEVFGRLADYQNPQDWPSSAPGVFKINGPRDLSANIKWQLPLSGAWLPSVAIGGTDLQGGASYFQSVYAVASSQIGPVRWSLGYARSKPPQGGTARVLDGPFGGAELRLFDTRATALVEHNGSQWAAGLRYYSAPQAWAGGAQWVGSVQRSFRATDAAGQSAHASSVNLNLVVPLGASEGERDARSRSALAAAPLPPVAPAEQVSKAPQTPGQAAVALEPLAAALRQTGLGATRVGMAGTELVVVFENLRYLQSEADALGIALGVAAELAPPEAQRVRVVSLKAGLPVVGLSVPLAAYRAWLRDEGGAGPVRAELRVDAGLPEGDITWASAEAGTANRLRVALKPLINYTLGTEYSVFDYSLAAQARLSAPLWRGAQVYADLVQRLADSPEMRPGGGYEGSQIRNGVQSLALQQSLWLGPRLFASGGVGRYRYDAHGAEGEAIWLLPWQEHSLHLRGQALRRDAGMVREESSSVVYRWRASPVWWAEGGYHSFADRSHGPSVAVSRWLGDVAVQFHARKGGANTFVGIEVSLPLAPRQGMSAAPVQVTGSPRFTAGLRTLITSNTNTGNWILPNAARPTDLSFKAENEQLDAGRLTTDSLAAQLPRLREAFFRYARGLVP